MSVLASRPVALDRAWAQAVLSAHAPGVRARACEVVSADVGTTTRVRVRVDHDGPPELPRRWFVKLPSASWRARAITALPRLPQTEVRFYAELAASAPVRLPRALAAARGPLGGFTLALADLAEQGARPGSPRDALTAAEAGLVVDQLAALHASRWEARALERELAWLSGPVRRLEDALGSALAVPLMRRGLARAGEDVPEAARGPALAYARARRRVMAGLAGGSRTLVHHDCHPGNLYWTHAGPGLLDWQLVRAGDGAGDLAYLLATTLEPDVRRAAEPELLGRWREGLARGGVVPPAEAALHLRYRAHLTYALEAMVVTLAIGGLMDEPACRGLIRRAAAACLDQDAFAAAFALAAG